MGLVVKRGAGAKNVVRTAALEDLLLTTGFKLCLSRTLIAAFSSTQSSLTTVTFVEFS